MQRHPAIDRIELDRVELGVSATQLCKRAKVRPWTWKRLLDGQQTPRRKTIEKLDRALRPSEPDKAQRREMDIRDFYGAAAAIAGAELEQDTHNDRWAIQRQRMPRARGRLLERRALAVYLVNQQIAIKRGDIAAAIGEISRRGVEKAVARVEDQYAELWLAELREQFDCKWRKVLRTQRRHSGYVNFDDLERH